MYQPSHYCIVVSYELYDKLKYKHTAGPTDPETGQPTDKRELKGVTYIIDVARLKAEHPDCETKAVYTEDEALLTVVNLG